MSPLRRWRHVPPAQVEACPQIVPHLLPPTFTVEVEFALETFAAQPFGKKRAGSSHHHALHCFSCLVVFSTLAIPTSVRSTHAALARGVYFICCVAHSTCLVPLTTLLCSTPPCTPRRLLLSRSRGHHLVEAVARKSTVGGRGRSAVAMVAAVLALVA